MVQNRAPDVRIGDGESGSGSPLHSRLRALWRSRGRLRYGIGVRLVIRVLLFSSAVTLVLTVFELYLDYRYDVDSIENRLSELEVSYRQSLGEGLWNVDRQQILLQANGILSHPAIRFVEVRETTDRADPIVVTAGRREDRAALSRTMPLYHTFRGNEQQLGVLLVQATLDDVYRSLFHRAIVILISQGAKTFLVSFFILYITYWLVTKHLTVLAGFLGNFDPRARPAPLSLRRRAPKHKDELDQLVQSFEAMRESLGRTYDNLRRSEEDYRGIYENALEGIVRISSSGTILSANPAFAKIFGFTSHDELTRTTIDFGQRFWLDPRAWESLVETLLNEGLVIGHEVELYRIDGRRVWVSISARPVRSEAGAPLFFEAIVADVTPRKQIETALRESEQRFRDYAEIASDWFWATGAAHEFTFVSEQVGAFGQDMDKLTGKCHWNIADDFTSESEKWREHRAILERHEPFRDFVYRVRRIDGEKNFISISGKPVWETEHHFCGYRGVARDVTGRIRAQETLQRSEAYLVEAQRLSHTGSWAWNVATRKFTHWSKEIYRLYGIDPQTGVPSLEAVCQRVHPDDRGRFSKGFDSAVHEKTGFEMDFRTWLPDGTIARLQSVGHPIFDSSGDVAEIFGTSIDVTERKRAEEERLASFWFFESMERVNRAIQGTNDLEEMMSDVLDSVLSIFECDRAWLVYPCDPRASSWRALMEHTRPDYPGAFALGRELPIDAEVARVFQLARDSQAAVEFGLGGEQPVPAQLAERFGIRSLIGIALYPKMDQPYMFGLHQCSYPRIWTLPEKRLFQAVGRRLSDALTSLLMLRNLRESEAKLENAQRIAHVGYWDRDLDTDRAIWSDETYRIMGLEPQQRTRSFADELTLIHPEDRTQVSRAVSEALRGGSRYDVEFRVLQPNGEVRTVQSQGDLVADESGRPRRMFGTIQDITERKRAEAELSESERRYRKVLMELAHVNRVTTMGQMTASIAHEVSQPIGAIVMNAYAVLHMIDTQHPDFTGIRQALDCIVRDGHRAGDVISRIRALIKNVSPRFDQLDINAMIQEVLALTHSELLGKGVSLQTELAPDLPFVFGDRVQLQQVMLNLIVNAVEAMGNVSEGMKRMYIGTECDASGVCVMVRDSGPGLKADGLENLFDAFYTTKADGLGMGLSISRSIVEAHGGRIWAAENASPGATFKFVLPVQPPTGS